MDRKLESFETTVSNLSIVNVNSAIAIVMPIQKCENKDNVTRQ